MTDYNFESKNVPTFFIRHRSFECELTRMDSFAADFAFSLIGRGQGRVALRSVNFRDRCLRHRDFRIHLDESAGPEDHLFVQDSTFWYRHGLADKTGCSFESVNFPEHYLRHRDFHFWLEPQQDERDTLFLDDATFYRRRPAVIMDQLSEARLPSGRAR